MKKYLAVMVLLSFMSAGCTGSFNLTKKVYNWHRSQDDKWVDEFGFLVCALLPIYGISTFADAIVFNSIEFWTGKNPVESAKADEKNIKVGDQEAKISYNKEADELKIISQKAGLHPAEFSLAKNGGTLVTKDKQGNVLYTTTKNEKGDFLVYDKNAKLLKSYSREEVSRLADQEVD